MTSNPDRSLEQAFTVKQSIAQHLNRMAETIATAEDIGAGKSSKLELAAAIADLKHSSSSLQDGVFRLLVLGDVKRGKSTVINALIGEDLLPRDVNASTAILTVLRYGEAKKVTVYFNDLTPPTELDFDTFKAEYSVSPDEAKELTATGKLAFPQVKQAVVEYPLPLLELGIEIVDSPGLNDTAARNQLSLDYIYNCNAILFVLRAVQPFTLAERRYLDNYIKERGLDVFFLINGWDEIANSLLDPEDQANLNLAQERSQAYFQSKLAPYLTAAEYDQRVFPISALAALRAKLNPSEDEADTSFDSFTAALNTFLTTERQNSELRQAKVTAEQAYNRLHSAIDRRIPLLEKSKADLKQKIAAIEPEFAQLEQLKVELEQKIQQQSLVEAKQIAADFEEYVLGLETTFLADFAKYQPNLDTFGFLSASQRASFNQSFKLNFDRYLTDKLAQWEQKAEQKLELAFAELLDSLEAYHQADRELSDKINTKLIGRKIIYLEHSPQEQLDWKNWTIGCLALASGNLGGIALAGAGISWKQVLINWLSVIGLTRFIAIFTGVFLNPYSVLLVGLGLAGVQTSFARDEFIKLTKQEFVKYLPKIAQEQKLVIEETVNNCFNSYRQELIARIDRDLQARQAELANLVQQEEMSDRDRTSEIARLRSLDSNILAIYEEILSITN